MNKNVCPECATENEQEYIYCKNCGTPLETKTEPVKEAEGAEQTQYQQATNNSGYTAQPNQNTQQQYYTNEPFNSYVGVDFIDGIPKEEMHLFIGRKAFEILPKFNKMELAQSKFSWCWPAFILGFLLGPLGAALWFYYRKMYKPAVMLSAIGAVLTIITSLLTMGTTSATIETFFDAFGTGDFTNALESLETIESEPTVLDTIASLLNDIVNTATGVICGLFGFYIYKKHCVNKILTYRSVQLNPSYYHFGLPAIGGVSGGMLVVGIAVMLGAGYISSFITTVITLLT